jgi:hypothetical protein
MIGAGIVKVNGLFDQPLAQYVMVKVHIGLGIAGNGRYMV